MQTKIKTLIILIIITLIAAPTVIFAENDIEQQINDKKTAIEDLKKRINSYQDNIQKKQEEAASLINQMAILENQIAKTKLDIQATEIELDKIKLEVRNTELEIVTKEDDIDRQKLQISSLIQEIHKNDQQNNLQIFLLNSSISEFYNQIEYTKEIQNNLQASLSDLKSEKKLLEEEKQTLDDKKNEFENLQADLELQGAELTGQVQYKDELLVETRNSEQKFTDLYWQAKKEQEAISAEISRLEKQSREKLDPQKKLSLGTLSWPVPKNKITSYFHDPSYPFRYLFEHPAVDIRAGQGTAIKAPADGYVLQAKDAGMGYSYVALIHGDGISTVYGHVSKIYVTQDEFVSRGEVIALSGGMPGTPGAGRLTSGPHLHFEVRSNGIPVNPLDYLP